jgi:NitT/TauT family transport system substrate-binding protein
MIHVVLRRTGRIGLLAPLLVAALAFASCGGDDPKSGGGGSARQVTVGVLPVANAAPLYLGMKQGFFADEGIEIKPKVGQGGADLITSMVAGESQFAFLGYTPAIVARSKGLPIKLVANADNGGTNTRNEWQVIAAEKGSSLRTPEDLAGKTIAVNAVKGVAEVATKAALEKEGVDPESVKLLEIPFPEAPAALEAGRVDAAWLPEPFLSQVLGRGGREVLAPYASLGKLFPNGTYATTEQVLADDPEMVEGFERAITKSLGYATDNPDEARQIITTFTKIPPDLVKEIRLPRWETQIDGKQVEELIGYSEQYGVIDKSVPLDELLWKGASTKG